MYAEILTQYEVKSLDRTFTYEVPSNLQDIIQVGMKVSIPFARKDINGFVISLSNNKPDCNYEIKQIKDIINKDIKLNKELMELGKFIQDKTLCTLMTAYQTMLPRALKIANKKDSYDKYQTYVELNQDIDTIDRYIETHPRSKKQIEILDILRDGRAIKGEVNSSSLKTLIKLGLVKEEKESVYRINRIVERDRELLLTDEQLDAYSKVELDSNNTYLLHGVTGSGKTEVYMHLAKNVIDQGKSVIMLVPEISLTTQIVNRFYQRFGNDVAIYHSNLSDGEKYDEYKKILNGDAHIVVGARSAIFAPVDNLGLIIIDEEHSNTYKQSNNPRYHAIDIAKKRCEYHNCPLILGSATPSLESMARAQKGVYTYLPLTKRVGKAKIPEVEIVNMATEYKKKNMVLSEPLKFAILDALDNNSQVMLFLNRRGYSTLINCVSCGYTYKCPHCDITLTYHKSTNKLKCHYCDYSIYLKNDICPECGERAIRDYGLGTEKIEAEIKELYPSARVVRMDADTTTKKGSHEDIINGIENHQYDIIIGTQMISKGLDFPDVTLVGIINADSSLNIPDFRSGENTFSLLSQVSGRAGRSNKLGKVIIQTFNPDNKTLYYVKNNDYLGNYKYEMNIRRMLKYPPYCYLISVKVIGKDYDNTSKEVIKVANYLKNNKEQETIILGPTTASQFKIKDLYRFQILIKYRFDDKIFKALKELDNMFMDKKDLNIEIDIDPLTI